MTAILPPVVDAAVDSSPRAHSVRAAVERLAESHPGLLEELAEGDARPGPGLLSSLVAVLSASPALGRLLQTDPAALGVLRDLNDQPAPPIADVAELVAWKNRELLRIAARDLGGLDPLEEVGSRLSRMADAVLESARALAGVAGEGLAIVAMGKAGAVELNYASDVDVVFVGEGDPRLVLDVARRAFRVDTGLRPEGRSGPLVRTLQSYVVYWARWAQAWERQALLKARPASGPTELCGAFESAATEAVWGHRFTADDLRQLRNMKARAEGEITRRGLAEREIKRGPGGIRDVEFSIQLLQLIHGHKDVALRRPATLDALEEMARGGYIAMTDAESLEAAYRFLRTVENRLQMTEGQQVHTVPAEAQERRWLARVIGFADHPDATAEERFDAELRHHRATARAIHERLFFRPLLEAFTAHDGPEPLGPTLPPEVAGERLAAFGFVDSDRARAALIDLTQGLTRASRLMQALLPLMLQWLSLTPDPDLGLSSLRRLMGRSGAHRDRVIALFRESPEAARRACVLLGTSSLLGERLRRDPWLLPRLVAAGGLEPRSRDELIAQAVTTVEWRTELRHRQSGLRLFKTTEEATIMAADLLEGAGVAEVGHRLSDLADATIEAALVAVEPAVPLAVIAMGSFGGAELIYPSDLDLLFVSGGPGDSSGASAGDTTVAEADATRLLRLLNGDTPVRRIYLVDVSLRPEGRDGPLARSLYGFANYYRRWAGTWERQALLRARPVAGNEDLGRRFMELARTVTAEPLSDEEVREIRRMKARIESERIPANEDPDFHLKLGRGSLSDVEWTAQLLQLHAKVYEPATLDALNALVAAGALAEEDARSLADSFRFCQRLRNRLFLVQGAASDSLPTAPDRLATLARSLDMTPSALRDRYRQVTRRARRVTERLFYGQV